MRFFVYIVLLFLLGFAAKEGHELYELQKKQTDLKEDFAELHMINYGLFNVQLWKERALEIFDSKIKDFKIDPKLYKDVNKQLRVYLNQMYKEYFTSGKIVDEFLIEAEKSGKINKLFLGLIKGSAKDIMKGFDLSSKIPSIADQLTKEIKSNEHVFTGYLTKELNKMLFDENKNDFVDPRSGLLVKYSIESMEDLSLHLKEEVIDQDKIISDKLKLIYLLLIIGVILTAVTFKWIDFKSLVLSFTSISLIMLFLGITLPMIDIDARLNSFEITILGSEISFDEQVLYYQSKSILDVTSTLIKSGGIDTKIVGMLVFAFSVIFPFLKLLLSCLFLFIGRVRDSKLAKGVIFYLGKWSMADVFVVAIFMAYIGFYGIISSQLNQISSSQAYSVETINYSKLSPGALFFTSYCILSIITSIVIDKVSKKSAIPN